jgi:hypothetical protein
MDSDVWEFFIKLMFIGAVIVAILLFIGGIFIGKSL